jgi:hypothetical protein
VQGAVDRRKPDNVLITCLSLAADWGGPGVEGFTVTADTKEEEKEEVWLLAFFSCFTHLLPNIQEKLT